LHEQVLEVQAYLDPSKYPSELGEAFEDKQQASEIVKDLNERLMQEVIKDEE